MTKSVVERERASDHAPRCGWCRHPLPVRDGPGRPRKFCSQRCRQWDWVSRQRAHDLALADGEVVADRRELDALHDDLYVLQCAVVDVDADLQRRPTLAEALESLQLLLEAARPLAARRIGSA